MAGGYSGTVFFGESLSDSGHFRGQFPEAERPFTGKFTTNPALVWAEYLARYYHGNGAPAAEGGDNYAQGGSRVSVPNAPADSTLSQVGARADPGALYTVWTGANDIFAVAAGAPAQPTLATAVGGTA